MKTREVQWRDLDNWVALRSALWPEYDVEELRNEAVRVFSSAEEACFLAIAPNGDCIGFAETAIYSGPSGLYAHLEGWYVSPDYRAQGYGIALLGSVEQWCLHRAISLLTSDTTPDYPTSPAAHAGAGFKTISEFTIFMKALQQAPAGDDPGAAPEK